MYVINRLTRTLVAVENQSVTVLIDTLVSGDLFGHQHHLAGNRDIVYVQIIDGRYVFLGYDQQVRRRLRIHVSESENIIILVDLVARNFAISDLAEQAICHDAPPLSLSLLFLSYYLQ
jgi:hypothetical protein